MAMVWCLYNPPAPPAPDPVLNLPAVCPDRSWTQVRLGDHGVDDTGPVPRHGAEKSSTVLDPEPAGLASYTLLRLDTLRYLHARDGVERCYLENLDTCNYTRPAHPSSYILPSLVLLPLQPLLRYTRTPGYAGRREEEKIFSSELEPDEWVRAYTGKSISGTAMCLTKHDFSFIIW